MKTLTVAEAAAQLGHTPERVRQAIRSMRLPAAWDGRAYSITPADLDAYRARLADPAAARAAARRDRIAVRIVGELLGGPLTRSQLLARMPGAERGGAFTTVLADLIASGAVIDAGRGKPLARAHGEAAA